MKPIRLLAIGASAGGVVAIRDLLVAIHASLSIPIVVVLHVAEGGAHQLAQMFTRTIGVTCLEPFDKERIGPGIWFAPAGYHLLVEPGLTFSLSVDPPVRCSRPSIDVLFASVADVLGDEAACVVLTGANEDGADGARALSAAGAKVYVEDPRTAYASAMPAAAIRAANPTAVAPLPNLASMLCQLECRWP